MRGAGEEVEGGAGGEGVALFLKQLAVAGKGGGVAGDIDYSLWVYLGYYIDKLGCAAFL